MVGIGYVNSVHQTRGQQAGDDVVARKDSAADVQRMRFDAFRDWMIMTIWSSISWYAASNGCEFLELNNLNRVDVLTFCKINGN